MVEKLLCKVKDGVVDGTMVERQDVASYMKPIIRDIVIARDIYFT